MAPPKDIARSYPKRGLTADVGFRSEPKFCGDGAATFPTTSDYAQTAASADLALGETYTVCAWIRHATSSSSTAMSILSSGSAEMTLSVFAGSNPALYVFNGSANMNTTGVFTIDLHTWYHVAIVIKSGGGNSQIFINGIDRTASHSLTFPASGTPSINLGGYLTGGWQGDLANVALFTSSLTEDQVRQAMRASDYGSHAAIATLEAFYPLSENFNDSTGNHNATASGSPEFRPNRPQLPRGLDLARGAAQARCFTGRCVDFDGSTDFLDMGTGLDKNYTTRSDRASFSVWFNTDQISASSWIYQNRSQILTDRPECETQLFTHPSLGLAFDGEGASVRVPMANVTIGQWHHFVGIADDADGPIKVYLDGVLYDTTDSAQAGANGNNFVIGARNNSPLQPFNGQLSNFKIFNVELTQTQVRELYHNPEMVIPTGVSASNLRRHYPLCAYNDTGGMGGRNEIDQGVEGVSGEYGGSPVMDFTQPVPCPQLGLQQSASRISMQDTTNNTYYLGTMSGTPFTNQGTLSGWFILQEKPANSTYNVFYCLGIFNTDKDMLEIVQDVSSGGVSRIFITNGAGSVGAEINYEFETGKLYNVTVTTLADAPYWQIWINGEKQTVPTRTFSNSRTTWDFGTNLIGGGRWGNTAAYGGTCHHIAAGCAAWNTVLSDSEIGQVYNSGVPGDVSGIASSNLQVWWKCDDLTSFKDYSGNGVSGAVTVGTVAPGLASFPENASGSTIVGDFSMKRKGVSVLNAPGSGRATLAANASLLPTTGGGYTLCAFVRLQSTDDDAAVIMSTSTGTNEWGTFYEGSTNKYKIVLSDGTTNILDRAFSGTVTDSEWHHIAWTIQLDATTATGETYIDGAPDLSFTRSSFNTPPTPSDFGVGYDPGNSNKQANAAIACLRIYQSVLSANEIKQVYSSDLRLIKGLANE